MTTIKEQKQRITLQPVGTEMYFICVDGKPCGIPLKEESAHTVALWLAAAIEELERDKPPSAVTGQTSYTSDTR